MDNELRSRVARAVVVAAAITVAIDAVIFVLLAVAHALGASAEFANWTAVGAFGTVSAAVGTLFAVGALAFAGIELENRSRELRRQAENERVARMPYLRVDIGLSGHHAPGFSPPQDAYVFDAAALGLNHSIAYSAQSHHVRRPTTAPCRSYSGFRIFKLLLLPRHTTSASGSWSRGTKTNLTAPRLLKSHSPIL